MVSLEIIGGPFIKVEYTPGMDIRSLLEASFNEIAGSRQLTYSMQFYGNNLGYLVNMVNETYDSFNAAATCQPFYYWEILQNGDPITTGVDHTAVNDGDTITFIYTKYDQQVPDRSTMHIKHIQKTGANGD